VNEFGAPVTLKQSDKFTPPVPLERIIPRFDADAGVQGLVILSGVVTPEGIVTNIKVEKSLGHDIDERAIEAFKKFRFSPATLNGTPIHATYREELTFAPPRPTLLDIQKEVREQKEREKKEKEEKKKGPEGPPSTKPKTTPLPLP
jgi:TonB family protein